MISRQAKGLVSTNDGRRHTINSNANCWTTEQLNWNNYKRRKIGHVFADDSTIKTCQKTVDPVYLAYKKKRTAVSSPFSQVSKYILMLCAFE
jgi:hypothetical protein